MGDKRKRKGNFVHKLVRQGRDLRIWVTDEQNRAA